MLRSLGDFCVVVPVEDVILSLVELGYMTVEHQTYRDLEESYRRWHSAAGLDPFASGPFEALIALEGISQVKICPANAWNILAAQAAGEAARRVEAAGGGVPTAPPVPAPRREASFAPESSILAWAFVAAVLGGTYLYVRHERRHRS